MLETEQMPSLGRGVRCRESCASGQVPASPSRGPWPHGKGCRLCDYRGAAVGLVRRSDKSGVLLDVCLLERGEQGGQHRVLTGARGPLAQTSPMLTPASLGWCTLRCSPSQSHSPPLRAKGRPLLRDGELCAQ